MTIIETDAEPIVSVDIKWLLPDFIAFNLYPIPRNIFKSVIYTLFLRK